MLLPFALSSGLAAGLMPARGADGSIILVICTADGMVETAFDPVTMMPVDDGNQDEPAQDPCAWAHAHASATLVPLTALAPHTLAPQPHAQPRDTASIIAAATGLPPATGPPSTL